MNIKLNDPIVRARIVFILLGLAIVVLMGAMFIRANNAYSSVLRQEGNKLFSPTVQKMRPTRGTIYDSHGTPVSIDAPHYMVSLDLYAEPLVKADPDSLKGELEKLTTYVREYSGERKLKVELPSVQECIKRIRGKADKRKRFVSLFPQAISYLDYHKMLDQPPFSYYSKKKGRAIKMRGIISKSLVTTARSVRMRPYGSLAKRTIGNTLGSPRADGLSVGEKGLELGYDSLLRGAMGLSKRYYVGGRYTTIATQQPRRGADIYSTLDMRLQSVAERSLRSQLARFDAESGTVVLMEVKTGRILAISNLAKWRGGYAETENYAVKDLSDPGSTFKVASIMVALDEGKVSGLDSVETGDGRWAVPGTGGRRGQPKVIRDASNIGYGTITIRKAIEKSSNVGISKTIYAHYRNDPDHFVSEILKRGYGLDLQLDIPGYARPRIRKRSDNPRNWQDPLTLLQMSYGYETGIPPIYTLAFFNAIANNGTYMRPYFVDKVMSDGDLVLENKPEVLIEHICKPETLQEIREMLYGVVNNKGTGKAVKSEIVEISGKSGTAQLSFGKYGYRDEHGVQWHQVSFCGYFPSNEPEYSCIVVIRKPSKAYSPGGGYMAGPVLKKIAEAIYTKKNPLPLDSLEAIREELPQRLISGGRIRELEPFFKRAFPDSLLKEDCLYSAEIDSLDNLHARMMLQPKRGIVPSVVGLSAREATYLLLRSGYQATLEGDGLVVSQSRNAGTQLQEGSKIHLKLVR